jgi:hypothetical protein
MKIKYTKPGRKDGGYTRIFGNEQLGALISRVHSAFHFVCCFNQTDKEKIIQGFKNKIKPEEAFTGKEFCELIGIDYQAIIDKRKEQDQKENLEFFCEEPLKIEECRKIILEILHHQNKSV